MPEPTTALVAITDDDRDRLREIARLVEVDSRRDDAQRDARFLHRFAEREPAPLQKDGGEGLDELEAEYEERWRSAGRRAEAALEQLEGARAVLERIATESTVEDMHGEYERRRPLNADECRKLAADALASRPTHPASPSEEGPAFAALRSRMLSEAVVDEVADEWTEGEEGLAPSFIRDLGETWLRVVAESFVQEPVGDSEITDEIVERACAAAFVPPISEDRKADMRRALEAVSFLAQPASPSSVETTPGDDEHWPTFIVQRSEQDDPLRPYRYVVTAGTKPTDLENCRRYVPATSDQEVGEVEG